MTRRKVLKGKLSMLCQEFRVPIPFLQFKKMKLLYGFYTINTIVLNSEIVKTNLACAMATLRHEFAHYIADLFSMKDTEFKARRFERNSLALEVLPITQSRLLEDNNK